MKNKFKAQAIAKARQLKESMGGTIFAFPNEKDSPFSSYTVVMCAMGRYFVYPHATDISEAATGIHTILEELKRNGMDADYERNVRLILYQAQADAPSTVMRRLKKGSVQ